MRQNVEKVLDRGDKLDDLVDKTEDLQASVSFIYACVLADEVITILFSGEHLQSKCSANSTKNVLAESQNDDYYCGCGIGTDYNHRSGGAWQSRSYLINPIRDKLQYLACNNALFNLIVNFSANAILIFVIVFDLHFCFY